MKIQNSKQALLPLILCLLCQPLAAQDNQAATYKIDNSHASLVFAISHFGLSYTYGRFNEISGSFQLADSQLTDAGFQFQLKTNSIDTNQADRDKHLKGPEFFDADQFPEITFETIEVVQVEGEYQVTGDLTIRGQTRTVMLPMTLVGIGKGPFGKDCAGFFTKFTIQRSDFGMTALQGQVGDKVSITFSFEGIRE